MRFLCSAHNKRTWTLHHKIPLQIALEKDFNLQDLFWQCFKKAKRLLKMLGNLTQNLPWLKTIILRPSSPCILPKTNTCAKFVQILIVIINTTFYHNHHHHHLGYCCGCARALVWCIYRGDTICQIGFWSHKGQVHIPVTIPPIKAVALLHFLITIETICQCKRPPSR